MSEFVDDGYPQSRIVDVLASVYQPNTKVKSVEALQSKSSLQYLMKRLQGYWVNKTWNTWNLPDTNRS
jgi:hypothetical protein